MVLLVSLTKMTTIPFSSLSIVAVYNLNGNSAKDYQMGLRLPLEVFTDSVAWLHQIGKDRHYKSGQTERIFPETVMCHDE